MKIRIVNYWERLSENYWFLPALMVFLAIVLSYVTLAVDRRVALESARLPAWIDSGGAEGARTLLSTVAGSMITIAGVTFSITIVALALASSQFGPRLLSNFMRDRGNQLVLGAFISTFTYCLLVLRAVRSVGENVFVPHVSVTTAILLALASVGVLIYFFHHVSHSIRAENLIALVGSDLESAIDRLFPESKPTGRMEPWLRQEEDMPEGFEEEARAVDADEDGTLQAINYETLGTLAAEEDCLLRLAHRPGSFIAQGAMLAQVWPGDRLDEELAEAIRNAFLLGVERSTLQDVEFAVYQLVEIAVRALSPGINDPFTAIACIDQLGTSLARLAERKIPSAYHYDEDGRLRLIADSLTFDGVIDAAFNQIRQHGAGDVAVTIRLLEALAIIAGHTRTERQRTALHRHAQMIRRASERAIPEEGDREDVERRFEAVLKALGREVN